MTDQTTSSWMWDSTLLTVIESMMITDAIDNLHFKRIADTADLNENEEKQKWKIIRILDTRLTRKKQEYKMRWKDTWLRRSELENAQKLLQEFERKDRVQSEYKQSRSTYADKSRWSLTTSFTEKIHMFLILFVVISSQISILSVRLFCRDRSHFRSHHSSLCSNERWSTRCISLSDHECRWWLQLHILFADWCHCTDEKQSQHM